MISATSFHSLLWPLLIISICGWIDDHGHIDSRIRILIYAIATALFITIQLTSHLASVGYVDFLYACLLAVSFIFMLWMINLYNFMDGIDTLAAIESITVSIFASGLFYLSGDKSLMYICLLLATSSMGFLVWNWPPAKIFMGDTGSCSLGFLFAALICLGQSSGISIVVWLILLAIFLIDASLTLIKRIYDGNKWNQAHRQHAYQLLVQSGWTHKRVALSVAILNMIYLWPLALLSHVFVEYSYLILIITYTPLIFLWIFITTQFADNQSV